MSFLGEDPIEQLEKDLAESRRVIIALIEAAGGEVFVHDDILKSVLMDDYELMCVSNDPLQRSRTWKTRRVEKLRPS